MVMTEGERRARALESFERLDSLDAHGELVRLILAEASLLADVYRNVRRHDVPHVRELAGLIDVLWQEAAMGEAANEDEPVEPPESLPLFRRAAARTNAPDLAVRDL